MGFFFYATALAILVGAVLYYLLTPPSSFPQNIPTIPFYVSLLGFFKDVDQSVLYAQYLEEPLKKYGAVKIFFGARWSILVQRPEYLNEMFRYEDIYAKSGNQVKIPYSVLAEYTGDNIISSHGENWRLYQSVIRQPLQASVDIQPILKNVHRLINMFSGEDGANSNGVAVPELIQRYTMANLGHSLLSTDFETLDRIDAPVHTLQLEVKREIFKPVFLNFPFLDLLPIPSRKLARRKARQFTNALHTAITEGVQKSSKGQGDGLGAQMLQAKARGLWTEQQLRHNMISVFLAGHENPQLLIISFLYLLGKDQEAQRRLRAEVTALGVTEPTSEILADMPYLNSVLYEVLRLFPPISQLINRKTTEDVVLGGKVHIPANTYIGYNAYGTGRDTNYWGTAAGEFLPERWGLTMEEITATHRRATSKAHFVAFHGGRRACLGQKFAMVEARVTVFEIVRTLRWSISPSWEEKMTQAGPLYPRMLKVVFEKI